MLAVVPRKIIAAWCILAASFSHSTAVLSAEPGDYDSGWRVAVPSLKPNVPILSSGEPLFPEDLGATDTEMRILYNHLLDQEQISVLNRPPLRQAEIAPPLPPEIATPSPTSLNSKRTTVALRSNFSPTVRDEVKTEPVRTEPASVEVHFQKPRFALKRDKKREASPNQNTSNRTPEKSEARKSPAKEKEVDQPQPKPKLKIVPETSPETVIPTPTPNLKPLPPLPRSMRNLRTKVRRVLKMYHRRSLNSQQHDPWEVMHGMLAYGVHSRIRDGGPRGKSVTAVGWLCYNKPCKRKTLLYVTPEGELRAKWGVGLQGHYGQLLAMLAQCQVAPSYPIRVGDRAFTIKDLVEAEKKTCYTDSELTFKLIGLMHYLDTDASWVNDQGQTWDIPRLIREELAQPIRGAACGGTHRLSGLGLAVKIRDRRGEPIDGEFARARAFVKRYQNHAFRLQNRDGSLSTEWFRGRGDEDDIDRRIKTTGHLLEWLLYTLEEKQLQERRTVRAVHYLANLMISNSKNEWEVGPFSHAIHAMKLYDELVLQKYDGQEVEIASKKDPSRPRSRKTKRRRR